MRRRVHFASLFVAAIIATAGSAQAPVPGISDSEHYGIHGPKFEAIARELLAKRRCKEADFKEVGGFWKSTEPGRPGQYFTYCGGMTLSNKIYVRVSTDKAEVVN